jgi:hypothetical protein
LIGSRALVGATGERNSRRYGGEQGNGLFHVRLGSAGAIGRFSPSAAIQLRLGLQCGPFIRSFLIQNKDSGNFPRRHARSGPAGASDKRLPGGAPRALV